MDHPHSRTKNGVWRQAKTGYILVSYNLWAQLRSHDHTIKLHGSIASLHLAEYSPIHTF